MTPILQSRNLTKKFPGVIALKGMDFDLEPGEIHAICGENGAGKSTLIKLFSGIHAHGSYEGELLVDGKPAAFAGSSDAERAGIAVIYQELAMIPEMTIGENLFLGDEPTRFGFVDRDRVDAESMRLMQRFGLDFDPATPVGTLGVGVQQLLEILKALKKNSRVLILDEPTAALTEREVQILLETLRGLAAEGISLIYISHKLDEVFALSTCITVIRDGEKVITLKTAETNRTEVVRHMVGREIKDFFPRRRTERGKVLLRVAGLTAARDSRTPAYLRDISLDVHAGEILGIGGLMGAGRSELLLHLFGAWGVRLGGTVELEGRPFASPTPQEAIRRGLVLVTEDRKRLGLHLDKSIGFNLSLSHLKAFARGGFIDGDAEYAESEKFFRQLRVKSPDMEVPVMNLSGGNQQKVVLGKALMTRPKIVFLDEPTRGIDVGAKVEVYELANELTAQGCAVVMVSSELPELIGMSDRIVMLHEGKVGGSFDTGQVSQEDLLRAAMGKLEEPASAR